MGIVDDLENSIDIVELVWKYAKLKKTGANYKALCPFPGHSEKTPSFVVSPSKQIGYCFWCHKWGGPIKFIMDIENADFREAVEILWQITGKEVTGFSSQTKEQIQAKKNIYSLYKDATNYYKQALTRNPQIQSYLTDRGLDASSIAKFHFWYADSWVSLYNYLKEKWYSDEEIQSSQIFLDVKQKKDKFIGRIIFPIQNLRWDFVAFAGRIVWQWEPKYLNSPASKIYDKSSILYWLFDARSSITKEDYIIITEWYMDTIALHEAGYTNTVAVSGTALTEKHIQIIKRLTKKIYLCFDNDKAWETATKSSLEILKNKDTEVKIILLEWGKDPDEILKKGKDFTKMIEHAVSPIHFFIKKSKIDITSIEEKRKFLGEILGIIKSYSDEIEKDSYIKEVAKLLNISINIIYDEYKKTKIPRNEPTENKETKTIKIEDFLLAYIHEKPELIDFFKEQILFPEWLWRDSQECLKDHKDFFTNLDIEKKEMIKALQVKILENRTLEESLESFTKRLNTDLYKKISSQLKNQMQNGDTQALILYNTILQKAKSHGIK